MSPASYIAIVSPFPDKAIYMDGWMSRIKTIDLLFRGHRRIYVDFQLWYPVDADAELVEQNALVTAWRLNPWSPKHRILAERIFGDARFVYIHTLHQAEYMLQFFDPEKMLIDVHGVVPEEEEMLGSQERSCYFGKIERESLARCKRLSVVTKAMKAHYKTKYGYINRKEVIHLPVFDYASIGGALSRVDDTLDYRESMPKPISVYAGGSQTWQCVDLMLDAIERTNVSIDTEIYSHNVDDFLLLLRQRSLDPSMFGGNVSKTALKEIYRRASFGFVIREDSVVNRVASPTKICDYCSHFVIPVVKFIEIGDFLSYDYAYLELNEYLDGYVPDRQTREWMIVQNINCMEQMYQEFLVGAQRLLKLAS